MKVYGQTTILSTLQDIFLDDVETKQESIKVRRRTDRLPTVRASVATRFQQQRRGSSEQVWPPDVTSKGVGGSFWRGLVQWGLSWTSLNMSGGPWTVRSNASWVMATWDPPVDRQTWLKTLPSHNFIGVQCYLTYPWEAPILRGG